MTTWEYLEAYVYHNEWIDSRGGRRTLASKMKIKDAEVYFSSATILDELGSEGWELAGAAFQDMGLYRLFLKRRLSSAGSERTQDITLVALAG